MDSISEMTTMKTKMKMVAKILKMINKIMTLTKRIPRRMVKYSLKKCLLLHLTSTANASYVPLQLPQLVCYVSEE